MSIQVCFFNIILVNADVAELVDALVLGTSIERCGGSSPFIRTSLCSLIAQR